MRQLQKMEVKLQTVHNMSEKMFFSRNPVETTYNICVGNTPALLLYRRLLPAKPAASVRLCFVHAFTLNVKY